MNKHPHKLNAALRASLLVRVSVGALAIGTLLGAAAPSHAFGPDRDQNPPQRKEERERPRQDDRDRDRNQRAFEQRAEEHRRIMQDNTNNLDVSRRVERMTPDERRDLRRQINEAGMEVYALPPRR